MSETAKTADQKFCHECGALIRAKAEICPECGVRQPHVAGMLDAAPVRVVVATNPKTKGMAVVCALLLGGIGLHKFYLGQPIWGIIYLVFCWTFVPAIIAFIEGLNYAFMSQATFDERYNGA